MFFAAALFNVSEFLQFIGITVLVAALYFYKLHGMME